MDILARDRARDASPDVGDAVVPWERINNLNSELQHFRRRVYVLITVGFALILTGLVLVGAVYVSDERDIKQSACQSSQTLVTQYEFFRRLSLQNATHLSSAEIRQRVDFYNHAESLVPRESCGMTLAEMQAKAKRQIAAALQ